MMGPADRPPARPNAIKVGITALVRVAIHSATANNAKPASMIVTCRPVLSARIPPSGTDRLANHSTRLVADPADERLQPCSTSKGMPKPKTIPSAALNRPQMVPATIIARIADRRGQTATEATTGEDAEAGAWYNAASRKKPSAQKAAVTSNAVVMLLAAATVGSANRHNAIPAGHELTKIAMAVAISLPANQSVTIFDIRTLSTTPPMPAKMRPAIC